MNKKELSELKKHFSAASDRFAMNRVATAFVDVERNIHNIQIRPYHSIPAEENECLMATLKRVLSGTLGKGLLEYEFPKEAYEEGGSQAILYEALQSKLEDETAVTTLMEQIVRNMDYVSTYAILVGHCTYTVFQKSKSDELDPYQSHDYRFLVAAICPVEVRVDGLIYNEDDNAIEKKNRGRDPHRRVCLSNFHGERSGRKPCAVLRPQAQRCQYQHHRKCTGLPV